LAEKTKSEVEEDTTKVAPEIVNKYASNNFSPLKGSKGRNLILNINKESAKNSKGGVRTSLFCDEGKKSKREDLNSERKSEVPSTEGETEEICDVGDEDCNIKDYFEKHKRSIIVKNPGKKHVLRIP